MIYHDECLLEGMWCEVTVQSGAEKRGRKKQQKTPTSFCFEEKLPSCVSSQEAVSSRASRQRLTLLLSVAAELSTGWGTSGGTLVSCSFMNGTSLLEGFLATCFLSLLRYCCVTGSFLTRLDFNWLPPKHLFDTWGWITHWTDEPTLPRLFFSEGGGVGWEGEDGWGEPGLEVKQKRWWAV